MRKRKVTNPKTEKVYKNLIRDKEIQGQIEQLKAHERLKIVEGGGR